MKRPLPLVAAAFAALLGTGPALGDSTVVVGGTGSPLGSMQMLADAYMAATPGTEVVVLPSLGSGGGINALAAGRIDVALSTRGLKEEEAAQGLEAAPLASTAVVFATQAANGVSDVSLSWIRDAFSGAAETWPDGERVRLVLRPLHDSDSIILSAASPEMKEAIETAHTRPGLVVAENAQIAATDLEQLDGALGTSTLTQILSEGRAIKALAWTVLCPARRRWPAGPIPTARIS